VDAGQRISVKFVHLDGYEDFVYTRITSRTTRQALGRSDLYEVQLTLNQRGPFGGGGGGGGSNPPPASFPPPTPNPVHFYAGTFSILGDYLLGDPSGQAATNVALTHDTLYNYHIEVSWTGAPFAYAQKLALRSEMTIGGVYYYAIDLVEPTNFPAGAGSYTFDSSFTTPDIAHTGTPARRYGAAAQGPHGHDVVGQVTFWVDPDGWDTGDPGPPSPGQQQPFDNLTPDPDGSTTVFNTLSGNGYAATTLRIEMNGVEQERGVDFTESDNQAGEVTFTHAPPIGANVNIWYQGI
jgi:hypothetical protein